MEAQSTFGDESINSTILLGETQLDSSIFSYICLLIKTDTILKISEYFLLSFSRMTFIVISPTQRNTEKIFEIETKKTYKNIFVRYTLKLEKRMTIRTIKLRSVSCNFIQRNENN